MGFGTLGDAIPCSAGGCMKIFIRSFREIFSEFFPLVRDRSSSRVITHTSRRDIITKQVLIEVQVLIGVSTFHSGGGCNRAVTCDLEISFLLFVSFRFSLFLSYSFSGRCLFSHLRLSIAISFLATEVWEKCFSPFPSVCFSLFSFSPFASSPFLESQTCFSVLSSKVSYQLSLSACCMPISAMHAFARYCILTRLVSLCSRRSLYTGNTCCLFVRLVFCTVSNRS